MAVVVPGGVYIDLSKAQTKLTLRKHQTFVARAQKHACPSSAEPTFADRHAFKPTVINISVADTSTVLVPCTARSATTGSAGFPKCAALWACRGDGWRAHRRGDG